MKICHGNRVMHLNTSGQRSRKSFSRHTQVHQSIKCQLADSKLGIGPHTERPWALASGRGLSKSKARINHPRRVDQFGKHDSWQFLRVSGQQPMRVVPARCSLDIRGRPASPASPPVPTDAKKASKPQLNSNPPSRQSKVIQRTWAGIGPPNIHPRLWSQRCLCSMDPGTTSSSAEHAS